MADFTLIEMFLYRHNTLYVHILVSAFRMIMIIYLILNLFVRAYKYLPIIYVTHTELSNYFEIHSYHFHLCLFG